MVRPSSTTSGAATRTGGGTGVRFDEGRGYGFIAPDDGGEDVFVHASELTDRGVSVGTGDKVQFSVIDGGRGLKADDVQVLSAPAPRAAVQAPAERPKTRETTDDDLCEIFAEDEFVRRITELLLEHGPQLTGGQVVELRTHLLEFARKNRWVD